MQKAAPDFTLPRTEATLDAPTSRPVPSGVRQTVSSVPSRVLAGLSRATDGQLALLIGGVLFAIAAWPLALVDVPPFQDLPNHLAAVTVIQHPDRYPEFVFNGYFKTNSALFTWLIGVGSLIGTKAAARL